jgi:hypothetical protein
MGRYAALLLLPGFAVKVFMMPVGLPDVALAVPTTVKVELGLVVPIPTLPPDALIGELPNEALPL